MLGLDDMSSAVCVCVGSDTGSSTGAEVKREHAGWGHARARKLAVPIIDTSRGGAQL
jgi:hypothetical protein